MYRDPDVVIEQTVENLRLIAEFLNEEIATYDHLQTPAMHRFREARSTVAALIPKLTAVRNMQRPMQNAERSICWNCD
jgi:hypothetical protein